MTHEALYGAVLTTTPLLLLALATTAGALDIFGPVDHARYPRLGKVSDVWADAGALLFMAGGAFISVLVLAGVIDDTRTWRYATAAALVLSILLVFLVASLQVWRRYVASSGDDMSGGPEVPPARVSESLEASHGCRVFVSLAAMAGVIAWRQHLRQKPHTARRRGAHRSRHPYDRQSLPE